MRGGISMISKRYAKANNPWVPGYDPSEEHNHIMYYDANNSYGWAMSQPLPYSGLNGLINHQLNQAKVVSWKWTGNIRLNFMSYIMTTHSLHSD